MPKKCSVTAGASTAAASCAVSIPHHYSTPGCVQSSPTELRGGVGWDGVGGDSVAWPWKQKFSKLCGL